MLNLNNLSIMTLVRRCMRWRIALRTSMCLVPLKEKYVSYGYKLIFWCWNLWFVRTRKNQLGCDALIFIIYLFINTCHGWTGLQCCIDDQQDWNSKVHKATLHNSTVMVFSMWKKVEDVKVVDCIRGSEENTWVSMAK